MAGEPCFHSTEAEADPSLRGLVDTLRSLALGIPERQNFSSSKRVQASYKLWQSGMLLVLFMMALVTGAVPWLQGKAVSLDTKRTVACIGTVTAFRPDCHARVLVFPVTWLQLRCLHLDK